MINILETEQEEILNDLDKVISLLKKRNFDPDEIAIIGLLLNIERKVQNL